MLHHMFGAFSGDGSKNKITGTVVLIKSRVYHKHKLCFQLVSSVNADPGNALKGKLGKPSYFENWFTSFSSSFKVNFDWDEDIGVPGAIIIKNEHEHPFYLKTITLDDIPDVGKIHFVCNSWIYPAHRYKKDRIFFSNKSYLPHETPQLLSKYREDELETLRGTGEGKLEEWDRVYDYACYNDLGDPDFGERYVRPVIGGSAELPYPRRGKTNRPSSKTDPNTESRYPILHGLHKIYVPSDEKFGHLKLCNSLGHGIKSASHRVAAYIKPRLFFHKTPSEFDSFQGILDAYEGRILLLSELTEIFTTLMRASVPHEFVKAFLQNDGGAPLLKYPLPDVIKGNKSAWRTDEEFAREMLAGVNPLIICRLEEFPPVSNLDREIYGNQNSLITKEDIEQNLDGLDVKEALKKNKLFILDHHDSLMPFVRRINTTPSKIYATRTILYLKDDGTLKPLAIELSLPHSDGDQFGAVSKVFTPAHEGVKASIWQLAKAYVAVNDSGYHQLISHWLHTHAVIEPFVIATNRQLSVIHPIHKLLHPHFRETMHINALARHTLLNAGGLLEKTVFPGKYAMELSSAAYGGWVFTDQAVPIELIKRGMAEKDPQNPKGCKLLLKDYPYAVDALDIWSAIETWVEEYCSYYYKSDDMVANDTELQAWWKEVREEGHGDKKNEKWWPEMKTYDEVTQTCTTIIWIASALHAAVNFGQYCYAGYPPNRPTISRRFMPEPDTPEYAELEENPDGVLLKTISSKDQSLDGIAIIESLSRHASDEVYLGQTDTPEWTADSGPLESFKKFGKKLEEIEDTMVARNKDEKWKNRVGPVEVPYTLLYPSSGAGLTGRGIPNSVSI